MKLWRTVSIVLAGAALGACKRDDQVSTTRTTSAAPAGSLTEGGNIRHTTATARISGARCDREDVCDPFGGGQRYPSRADCDHAEFARTRAELPESDCPNGVDGAELGRCLSALAEHDCASLTDPLAAIDECKPSALCMHGP